MSEQKKYSFSDVKGEYKDDVVQVVLTTPATASATLYASITQEAGLNLLNKFRSLEFFPQLTEEELSKLKFMIPRIECTVIGPREILEKIVKE